MNKKASIGKAIPKFELPATGEQTINLATLKGNLIVLYFYPRDNTPGCTREGQDFRDQHLKFKHAGAIVFGVSRDSVKSHEKFKEKQEFPFDLIADEDETLCTLFDVMKLKNMYGKKVRGIERSTFLINKKAVLIQEWRKVKVDGHVDDVLTAIKALKE